MDSWKPGSVKQEERGADPQSLVYRRLSASAAEVLRILDRAYYRWSLLSRQDIRVSQRQTCSKERGRDICMRHPTVESLEAPDYNRQSNEAGQCISLKHTAPSHACILGFGTNAFPGHLGVIFVWRCLDNNKVSDAFSPDPAQLTIASWFCSSFHVRTTSSAASSHSSSNASVLPKCGVRKKWTTARNGCVRVTGRFPVLV